MAMSTPCTRRAALAAIAVAFGTVPLRGLAQKSGVRKMGFLSGWNAPPAGAPNWLGRLLKTHGFEEGRNLVIERRYGGGDAARMAGLARELVDLEVELILAAGNTSIAAAQQATRTIPIVMSYGIAPVEAGFIKSLARPGGNVTGNAFHTPETSAKTFDLLREAAPRAARAVMLWNPTRPGYAAYEKVLAETARQRSVALEFIAITQLSQVAPTLQSLEARLPDFLLVGNDVSIEAENPQIAEFARRRKLPSIGTVSRWVEAGGLFYFGPDENEAYTGMGRYVARILNGAKPQDLPVEQPSIFRFTINATTARAIGLTLPESLRLRADRIIGD